MKALFLPFFLIFFVFILLLIRLLVSKFSDWKTLEGKYKTKKQPLDLNATNLIIRNCNLGGMPMQNILKFYDLYEGLLITQSWIVRGSKFNLFIPWEEIVENKEKKLIFGKSYQLIIGSPFVSFLEIGEKDFEKIKDRISHIHGKSDG